MHVHLDITLLKPTFGRQLIVVAYRMAAVLVTLNDLEGHSPVAGLSSAIRRTFVQHFTRFQLTACSHAPSAAAGLLVV